MEKPLFNRVVETWGVHAERMSYHSNIERYLDCDEYRYLRSQGEAILPYVQEFLMSQDEDPNSKSGHTRSLMVNLVADIAGENFIIPEEIRGRVRLLEEYTRDWLSDRYPQQQELHK